VRKQRIPIMTTSALGFIAMCITVIGAWDLFTEARSQNPAPQEQMSPAELSAAVDAQRQSYAKQTRSATFDQRLQKLSEKTQRKGTVAVIVKAPAAFRHEGQMSNAAELLAQCEASANKNPLQSNLLLALTWVRIASSVQSRQEAR